MPRTVGGSGFDVSACPFHRTTVGCSYDRRVDYRVRTAANRRMLADFFDGLDDDQLQTRSLCDAWTVREVLGHLVMPLSGSVGGFLLHVVRARGSLNRASEAVATDLSRRPVGEFTALLRSHADLHGKAPGVGPMGHEYTVESDRHIR